MFRVKGADQKEYGPVGEDILRQWIQEGRMNRFSLVQKEGESGWKPLEQFPEFSEALAAVPAAVATPAATPGIGGIPVQPFRSEAVAVGDPVIAAGKLKAPAIMMIVTAGLSILHAIFSMVQVAMLSSQDFIQLIEKQTGQSFQLPFPVEVIKTIALITGVFPLVFGALVVLGATRMLTLRNWGLGLAGSIILILPCCGVSGPLCLLGLPVGIWALVVLNKPEVKAAFR